MKTLFMIILIFISFNIFAQKKDKVTYKYKKFQEFDMETLGVTREVGGLGDLSSDSREQIDFKNRLPLRRNFNPELRRSVEIVR